MKKYNKEAILDYIIATESITLGALQKELHMSRTDTENLVWKLAEEGLVTQSIGYVFRPTVAAREAQEEKQKMIKKARDSSDEHRSIRMKSLFDDESEDSLDFDKWWDEVMGNGNDDDDD